MARQKIIMADPFDFDAWTELWHRDPAAFEEARRVAVEALIIKRAGYIKLHRLQWRVDAERRRAKTPLNACLVLSTMMWDAFAEMQTEIFPLNNVLIEMREPRQLVLAYSASMIPLSKEPPA